MTTGGAGTGLGRGPGGQASGWAQAAAMIVLLLSLLAGLGATGWALFNELSAGSAGAGGVGAMAAWVPPLTLGVLVAGLAAALGLRRRQRKVKIGQPQIEVPAGWRCGLTARLIAVFLVLTLIGLMAVAWIESCLAPEHSLALPRGGFWLWSPLLLAFSGLTAAAIASGVRQRVRALTGRLVEMAREDSAQLQPLPVVLASEAGQIAAAFNQLLVAIEDERATLLAYTARVEQTDRLQARFLRNVSHELRTPLNSIIGFSDLLLKTGEGSLNARQHEAVQIVNRSGERLLALINDILLMAQLEADRAVAMPAPIELGELLADAGAACRSAGLPVPQFELEPDAAAGLWIVDRALMTRAVSALMEQAIKAESTGGRLRAEREPAGRLRLLTLIANGPCPVDLSRRLFEGFRGPVPPEAGRTGVNLGLALGQRIARLHGGGLDLVERAGDCFLELWLPGASPIRAEPV